MTKEDLILEELSKINLRIDDIEENLRATISCLGAIDTKLSSLEDSLDGIGEDVSSISFDVSNISDFLG